MDSVPKNKRLWELSLLNVFFCLLVILIHVSAEPVTLLQKDSWQYVTVMVPWRLAACAVPGFVFLSGLKLFLNKGRAINYGNFYRTRFMKIVIPYVLWVAVYYYYFVRHGYFTFSLKDLLMHMLLGDLVGHLYFIIIIVQFYLLAPLWTVLVKKIRPGLLLPLALIITAACKFYLPAVIPALSPAGPFPFNDRLFTSWLFYWILGCCAGLYYERFRQLISENLGLITGIFLFTAISNAVLSYFAYSRATYLPGFVSMHYIYCIASIPFFYMLFSLLSEKALRYSALIGEIDIASYLVYLAHPLTIFIINDKMAQAGINSVGSRFFLRALFAYFVTISLCVIWKRLKKLALTRAGSRKGGRDGLH